MSAPVDYHQFTPSADTYRDGAGRLRIRCATCGAPSNAWRHRGRVATMAAAAKAAATKRSRGAATTDRPPVMNVGLRQQPMSVPATYRPPTGPLPAKQPDWRVRMLALAVDEVLKHAQVSPVLEIRVKELERALRSELYGVAKAPPLIDPAPSIGRTYSAPAPTDFGTERSLAASFRNKRMRELFLRGIKAGWQADHTGGGHVRLKGPAGGLLILSASAADRGRGWENLKANAKRQGLDTDGL